jgi:hypothetical protein
MDEKIHKALNIRMVLKSAEELTQGDVDRMMEAVIEQPPGKSVVHDNGNVLRAALIAGIIELIVTPDGQIRAPEQVDGMQRTQAKWCAGQVNALYRAAEEVPNE